MPRASAMFGLPRVERLHSGTGNSAVKVRATVLGDCRSIVPQEHTPSVWLHQVTLDRRLPCI